MAQPGTRYVHRLATNSTAFKVLQRSVSVADSFVSNNPESIQAPEGDPQANSLVNSGKDGDEHAVPLTTIIIIILLAALFLTLCLSMGIVLYIRRRKQKRRTRDMTQIAFPDRQRFPILEESSRTRSHSASSQEPLIPAPLPSLPPVYRHHHLTATRERLDYMMPRSSVRRQVAPATFLPSIGKERHPNTLLPATSFPNSSGSATPNLDQRFLFARPGQTLKVVNGTPSDVDGQASFRIPSPRISSAKPVKRLTYTDLPKIRTNFAAKDVAVEPRPVRKRPIESTFSRGDSIDSMESISPRKPRGARPLPTPPSLVPGRRKWGNQTKSQVVELLSHFLYLWMFMIPDVHSAPFEDQ